jgi:putative ABC transport system permease protein
VISQDVRYAVRTLARSPGFTLVALVTVALGVGGTTAIFSVVDGILLRPLPYPNPNAIVSLNRIRGTAVTDGAFSAADFLDYKRDARQMAALSGYRQDIVDMTGGGEPVRLTALETTAAFFDVFGLPPLAGRVYSERADGRSGQHLVVISEKAWSQHFGRADDVVGRTVRLNAVPYTIIGVMPAALMHPQDVDIWMLAPREVPTSPLPIEGDPLASRDVQYFSVIGRTADGVSLAVVNEELRAISARLGREFRDGNTSERVEATPFHEELVGDVRAGLLVLLGAVAFVLLIACANVASLLLARGTARRRELALRSALGAPRRRLVRQLLTESVVLAGSGGVLGLLIAYWGVKGLLAVAPESIPRLADVGLDLRVTAFAVAVSAIVGVLFGIAPAFQAARADVVEALKDGGRTGTARAGLQKLLVVGEVALALVLLIGAGLMLASFARLRAVDVGFTVRNLVVVFVPLPQARYDNAAQKQFYSQLHEKLRANPLTQRSALVFPTPFSGGNARGGYEVQGRTREPGTDRPVAQISSITPGYFQTMGIPLLRGRDVAASDAAARPGAVIINKTLADREWPEQDPLGKRIALGNADDPDDWLTVVGVVADSKRRELQGGPEPVVYLPHTTFTLPYMGAVIRSEADVPAIANAVRDAVRSLDRELPMDETETLESVLESATGQPRFRAFLITAFAVVALVLASVGLFGLISYTVAHRVPEIGVRLALGATPGQVGRLVLRQGLLLAGGGVALGLMGAVAASRLLEGLLFSVSATEPAVYAGLTVLLLAIAGAASYLPARRAMRVDPMSALRAE